MIANFESDPISTLNILRQECEQELENILDFWCNEVYDPKSRSFVGRIDQEGKKYENADLSAVLVARILWTFSAAYKKNPQEKYKQVAQSAFELLVGPFWDDVYGGLFWSLNSEQQASSPRKQGYAQGFGIYGLSEYFSAFKDREALQKARSLFQILEEKFRDPEFGGYLEALDQDWKPIEDLRLSEKDANVPKSMNTHLHILEPYSNLYRVDPNPELESSLVELVELFLNKIFNPETGHLDLFFSRDWKGLSSIHSYGHDIEGAWLLREATELIHNPDLFSRVEKVSLQIAEVTLAEGIDSDGSIFYELEDGHLDKDKHWWPQAEALVGFFDAYEISGKSKYLLAGIRVWNFIQNNLVDRRKGEWFWRVRQDGRPLPTDDKAGFWKCPYHNSRAMMETIRRIEQITIEND